MNKQSMTNQLFVRSGNAMRMFLLNSTVFILIGIWLTGFEQVHWFIYVIPVIYTLSASFGVCPGINIWRMILKD